MTFRHICTGFELAWLSAGITVELNAALTNCISVYLAALGVYSDCSYAPWYCSNAARVHSVLAEAWHTRCDRSSGCRGIPSTWLLNSASVFYMSVYGCMTERKQVVAKCNKICSYKQASQDPYPVLKVSLPFLTVVPQLLSYQFQKKPVPLLTCKYCYKY